MGSRQLALFPARYLARYLALCLALCLALGLVAFGCAHAKTTDRDKTTSATPDEKDTDRPASSSGTRARAPARHRDPSAVPVASSAHDLLQPGAEQQIRDKLAARGFMDAPADGARPQSLRAPLQRFQDANDLPATGTPDAETLRKLGLDPDAVFRKATSAGKSDTDGKDRERSDATEGRPGGGPE